MTALRFVAERGEGLLLVGILLTVAGFAGAASFTHVHDWTMRNSPAGTKDWFGWANATISELVPTACALVIRRRRRTGAGVAYPLGLLVAAVALSLAAQLAVAKPGLSGGLLSAVPALAFVALTKVVLSTKPAAVPVVVELAEPQSAPVVQVAAPTRANGAIPSGVIR
jgi:peptidoglycan/LPS O-acetylase OafA/YrhL